MTFSFLPEDGALELLKLVERCPYPELHLLFSDENPNMSSK